MDISRAVEGAGRLSIKICGPEKEVLSTLRATSGVQSAEMLGARDADSITYYVESVSGLDIRKILFRTMAQKGWPIIGMESLGANLEDVFLSVVDEPAAQNTKKKKGGKA